MLSLEYEGTRKDTFHRFFDLGGGPALVPGARVVLRTHFFNDPPSIFDQGTTARLSLALNGQRTTLCVEEGWPTIILAGKASSCETRIRNLVG
mmetsp:Transcript_28748/g.78954  ORF Transcript_28748/g.78954 Transcript_28748/m.78954 type:complete len:93 (-) Transcript_28748:34-312(-)